MPVCHEVEARVLADVGTHAGAEEQVQSSGDRRILRVRVDPIGDVGMSGGGTAGPEDEIEKGSCVQLALEFWQVKRGDGRRGIVEISGEAA